MILDIKIIVIFSIKSYSDNPQYFFAHQDGCQCLTSIFDRRNKSCSRFRVFQSVVPLNNSDLFSHESWMS